MIIFVTYGPKHRLKVPLKLSHQSNSIEYPQDTVWSKSNEIETQMRCFLTLHSLKHENLVVLI